MSTRRLPHRLSLGSLLLVSALSVTACGGDDDKGSESPASSAAASADLVVTGVDGIRWDKESYTATAGDVSIMLRNASTLPHTLKIVAADNSAVGEELEATGNGDEQTGTFTLAAGTYTIICTVPGHGAMKATLTVS
jgi:plastocyanin